MYQEDFEDQEKDEEQVKVKDTDQGKAEYQEDIGDQGKNED